MDAQSPSKRFTRGIPLHVENSVERPSFSLGLTQDFGEVSGSMSKSNTMQEIKSKLKNNPIRLEGMSAKLKQSNIKIVEGGKKDQSAAGSSKKRKEKSTNYTEENAKRKKVVVSGLLEHDEHVDVILYYIRKRAKYSDTNAFSFITVDCNFSNLITNVWDAYYNFESNINKESTEESIIEYINGYRMHVARPWHTVDNILIPVNIKEIFHWILIVVSINDRSIQIYDSLRGGALHDSSVENEIKKYAQLVPMYLSKSDFYGKKGIDISSHPKYKSHSECDSFEMIYVNDIPQQDAGRLDCGLYVAAYADHISNGNVVPKSFDSEFTRIQYASLLWNYGVQKIQADATSDSEAPERPIRIHRDCDSSEKITIN
uniref:Ulp1 protease family, C-terminal catalytic domain containing protein n=1 Tax=Solanum tuberosum TaxID=4113 RepID=M0ZJV8_SOLTU